MNRIAALGISATLVGCSYSITAHRGAPETYVIDYNYTGSLMPVAEVMTAKISEVCPDGHEILSEAGLPKRSIWRMTVRCIDR